VDVSCTAQESTKPLSVGFRVLQCAFALLTAPVSVSKLIHALAISNYTTYSLPNGLAVWTSNNKAGTYQFNLVKGNKFDDKNSINTCVSR
jgi:hypothetical protein